MQTQPPLRAAPAAGLGGWQSGSHLGLNVSLGEQLLTLLPDEVGVQACMAGRFLRGEAASSLGKGALNSPASRGCGGWSVPHQGLLKALIFWPTFQGSCELPIYM